jgi:esterase/lipase superfamily enzyme
MDVACWGHYGKPVLLFPTAGGDYLECERFLMVKVLRPMIEAGRIKLYACASISNDAWLSATASGPAKANLQASFGAYLTNELLPFISADCDGYDRFAAAGASLGAYNAVTAATRNPRWFDSCVAMSGTYDFDRWSSDFRGESYYHHQPLYFLGSLPEGAQLQALRAAKYIIATGQGRAEAPDESRRLAWLLDTKGIPHQLEVWGQDAHHDWPTWRTMLPMFLNRLT